MKQSFVLKGNIIYSRAMNELAVLEDSWLVCEDNVCAGAFASLPARFRGLPVIDCGSRLITPGLVDLHTHAPQYAFRGLGMDMELLDWLGTYTFPEEAKYADLSYAGEAYQYFVDDLRRGATTRACIFGTIHTHATLDLMRRLEQSGLAALVGKVNMDRNAPDALCEGAVEDTLAQTRAWIAHSAGFVRVRPILTPRFTPSCTDALLRGLGQLQQETGLPVQSHLSENPGEIEWVKSLCPDAAHYGDSYDRFGLFGTNGPCVMAHCVHCPPEEAALMKQNGVFIAHCPQSNTNLSSGVAPVRAYLDHGQRVGLGTDVAGGAHLSMFRAMTDAIAVSKLRWRLVDDTHAPLTFAEAFYLATRGGGAFFGKVGAFEPGWAFDALVLDDHGLSCPRGLTLTDRLERMAYYLDDRAVAGKFVDGRALFLDDDIQFVM